MEKLDEIASYWNTRAKGYSLDNQEELEKSQGIWMERVEKYMHIVPGLKVLDLGCGPGFFSIFFSLKGCHVTGIDYSDGMLEEARSNAYSYKQDVVFKKMDVQNLEFDDHTFDLIITRNVTWNLEKPTQAYKEMLRVLKKGGHLINFDGNHYYSYEDESYIRENSTHKHMEGIDVSIIDTIAKDLKLSYKLRPQYDEVLLKEIGFEMVESDCYDVEVKDGKTIIRQFSIHAIK